MLIDAAIPGDGNLIKKESEKEKKEPTDDTSKDVYSL